MNNKVTYYDDFLKLSSEVQNKKPDIVKSLAVDIDIELYLLPTSTDPKGYAYAVVCVKREYGTYRYKYEGGRVFTSPEEMIDICIRYIRGNWDLDMWRKYAEIDEVKETRFSISGIFNFLKKLFTK